VVWASCGQDHWQLAGSWQDKVDNLDASSTAPSEPMDLNFFGAKMTVVNSPCQLSLTIVLEEGLPVKKLVATLKKC